MIFLKLHLRPKNTFPVKLFDGEFIFIQSFIIKKWWGTFNLTNMKQTKERVAEIQVSYQPAISNKPIIISALDAFVEIVEFFPSETIALQEKFVVMYLNRCNRVLGVYPLSTGGITGTMVDIRLILSVALKVAATGIILAHNHPSGNLQPSSADKDLTGKN